MGQTIVITGAANGLGRELVAAFAPNNQVVALDIDSVALPLVAAKLGADFRLCDVADYNSASNAIDYVLHKYGQINYLINNAGIYIDGELSQNDPQKIKKTIEVNTLGPIYLARAVVPHFKHRKKGTIINIVSTAGLHPRAQCSVYHASKYALTGFGQSLALELEPLGIKVVNIYPDVMNTSFSKNATIHRDFDHALNPEEVVKLVKFLFALDSHTTLTDVTIKHI